MLNVDFVAHRKDDVAVSLVEVAMSTLRHQHQLHFLEGLEEYAPYCLQPSLQPPSLSLGTALRGRWPTQHKPAALTGSLPQSLWLRICCGVLPVSFPCPACSSLVLWKGL